MKVKLKLLFFIFFSFFGFRNLNSMEDDGNHLVAVITHDQATQIINSVTGCIRTTNVCLERAICCGKWTTALCAVTGLSLTVTGLLLKYLHS